MYFSSWGQGMRKGDIYDVTDYGASTQPCGEAVQRAADDWIADPNGGILYFPPSRTYVVERPIEVDPRRHLTEQTVVEMHGARILSGHNGYLFDFFNETYQFRDLIWSGGSIRGVDEQGIIRFRNRELSGATYRLTLRDIDAETCAGHGLEFDGQVFETVMENCAFLGAPSNADGFGIYMHATQSSVMSGFTLRSCTTKYFRRGVFNTPSFYIVMEGGFYNFAREEGVRLAIQGGYLNGVRAESNWQGAASQEEGGAGIVTTGWCTIMAPIAAATGKQRHGVRVFSAGKPTTIIGDAGNAAAYPAYSVNGPTGAVINLIGVPSSEIFIASENPTVNIWGN